MATGDIIPPDGLAPEWARGLSAVLLRNKTLLERLDELRNRLFRIVAVAALAWILAWFFYSPILSLLTIPLHHIPGSGEIVSRGKLAFTTPTEAFTVRLRVVGYSGILLASPVVVWELWRFLTGGSGSRASRFGLAVVASSLILFVMGGAAAFAFIHPALKIFLYLGGPHIVLVPRASQYISFLLLLIVAFGLTFEYPLFLLALIMAGVINSALLRKRRRLAYFVLLVVSVVITPTVDPVTPLALALPLALLYEATIIVGRSLKR